MPDVMTKEQRSMLMSLVRARNTRFELTILRFISRELYPLGYRYRKHVRGIRGTPDIAFAKYKLAVFLDSDFWHGRDFENWAHAPFAILAKEDRTEYRARPKGDSIPEETRVDGVKFRPARGSEAAGTCG